MQKILIALFIMISINLPAFSGIVQGGVEKEMIIGTNKVVDYTTNTPIAGAKISIPQEGFTTYTDANGNFSLGANFNGQTVLSVEKPGYKPFSMTVNKGALSHPMVVGIEKATPHDITVDKNMIHLGDNSYSDLSANAGDFQIQSVGPFYSRKIKIPTVAPGTRVSIVFGSVIGIDTLMAKSMGQNKINSAYASPPQVYFNGNKIAELQINGDGEKIKIPYNLIKQNQMNEITVKTGRNMMQTSYVDYDDMEFMNLSVEIQ